MINSAKEVKGQIFAFRQEKKKHKCVLELHFNTSLRNKIRRVKSCCHCSDIVRSQADLTNNRTKQTICCFLSEGRACCSVNTHDSSACVCVCVATKTAHSCCDKTVHTAPDDLKCFNRTFDVPVESQIFQTSQLANT